MPQNKLSSSPLRRAVCCLHWKSWCIQPAKQSGDCGGVYTRSPRQLPERTPPRPGHQPPRQKWSPNLQTFPLQKQKEKYFHWQFLLTKRTIFRSVVNIIDQMFSLWFIAWCPRRNLNFGYSCSNVCVLYRCSGPPPTDSTNYRKCVTNYLLSWLANWQWLFTGHSWRVLKSWYTGYGPENGLRCCFTDELKGAVSRNSAKLGITKCSLCPRETKITA